MTRLFLDFGWTRLREVAVLGMEEPDGDCQTS